MPNFSPPYNPVGSYAPSFMTNLYGASWDAAWNTCIYGDPTQTGANVLSNCVGYAQGRMLDIYREITGFNPARERSHPFVMFNQNAGDWYQIAIDHGFDVQATPREGSVLVTSSHVAVVETFDESTGLWWVSESGSGDPTPYYYQHSLYESGGRWYDSYGTDPLIIGFILIPGVSPTPPPVKKSKWIYYLKNQNNYDIF